MRKIFIAKLLALWCILFSGNLMAADWSVDVTVSQDGSEDFTTITEAINNNPNDGSNYVIFIKNGVYHEKLFITSNNISLLGEDKDKTIITQAILRRIWLESNSSDWGVATINIYEGVTNLTLANLTVQNNFAELNPDVENNTDHTMAIRGGGNRIIIVNCKIIATGGDTLSLWNTDGGMFYHSGCFFEGYVDYVCPRGYCYISNSDFYGYNSNASIWHDGAGGKDHKLVVKNSYFDGVENFGLGRYHRVSAFYLLDCDFSENLKNNGGINYVGDSTKSDRDTLGFGIRVYYDRCNRETGNYDWHSNNLKDAEGSPARESITDRWTFNSEWKPESTLKGLLPCSFLPSPGYHAKKVDVNSGLHWLPGKDAVKHLVYFGTNDTPGFIMETTDTLFIPGTLEGSTKYYWRIDEVTSKNDTIRGSLWCFYTNIDGPPSAVQNIAPPNDTSLFRYLVIFDWSANALEVDSFRFYFGGEVQMELISTQVNPGYELTGLAADTTYFWRVDALNDLGVTKGETWSFKYKPVEESNLNIPEFQNMALEIYPQPVTNKMVIQFCLSESADVVLSVYDIIGRPLYIKQLGLLDEREQQVSFNIPTEINLATGQYFAVLSAKEKSFTQNFIVQ
ncbi:MAG: T9SS type A sorting domain-containing protein [Bacteroidales bacterium]|nr:T9SS type A sorting domain-containing protein [Bacteroidales bacterium]MBN2820548.1 T9SS type A sorting domain-containing protein [Bacteroidales bacterium]